MLLKVFHRTLYSYDAPVHYALQRLRLQPQDGVTQKVLSWSINVKGATSEVRFPDQFGNDTTLLSVAGEPHIIEIIAEGEVEVHDTAGVSGAHTGFAPLWLFQQQTSLTEPGHIIKDITDGIAESSELERLHLLSSAIRERVSYKVGVTNAATTAEQAAEQGEGVCQDHSHIFLSAARMMNFPARYVSGYLLLDDVSDQVATHAWAEAHVNGLGWVAFDVSNGISPDERYVRLATGRDYRDAMPVSGIRLGAAREELEVQITVEQ